LAAGRAPFSRSLGTWCAMLGLAVAAAFGCAGFGGSVDRTHRGPVVEEAPAPPAAATAVRGLRHVPGGTAKMSQLIGDYDKHLKQPTRSQSESRYGVIGCGLGLSFEHEDHLVFVFGDTEGVHKADSDEARAGDRRGGDCIGYSHSTSPEELQLEFYTDSDGNYVMFRPHGRRLPGYQIPSGGISIDGQIYVVYNLRQDAEDYPRAYTRAELATYEDKTIERHLYKESGLATFDERTGEAHWVRAISNAPMGGRFITVVMREQAEPVAGLPEGVSHVLMWGTGVYRASHVYLSACPAKSFASGEGTVYFAGYDSAGAPIWSATETDAAPVVEGRYGNAGVIWVEELGIWVMLHGIRETKDHGQALRWSETPYGPWSEPVYLIHKRSDEFWKDFVHTRRGDGLAGPVIGKAKEDPEARIGGLFAPYAIERFTRVEGDRLHLYWTMSTWNPYVVVLMHSELEVLR